MKKYILAIGLGIVMMTISSCRDEWDNANTENFVEENMTRPTDFIGMEVMSVSEFKDAFSSLFKQSNSFLLMENDTVVEGVVIANDEGGNLYQTIVLANIDQATDTLDPTQCLELALKNTCLHPFFQIGQKVKVDIKGFYTGCYSYVPKLGQPYYTSKGNLRLGAALLQMCRTNVYLDGSPSRYADKVHPLFLDGKTLSQFKQDYVHCPMLVTVEGYFQLNDTTKHLADYDEHDDGYGVNRDFKVDGMSSVITVRTSTQNEVAYISVPRKNEKVRLTGIMTYYDGWQIQLCDKDCFEKVVEK